MIKSFVVSLFMSALVAATSPANAQSGEPVAGKDYVEITNGTPPDPSSNQIVV